MLLRASGPSSHETGRNDRCQGGKRLIRYAGSSPEVAAHNLYGLLLRHDDPAGSRLLLKASLGGGILQQSRRFLAQETAPDWPLAESLCDALLEPGEGALTAYSMAGQLGSICLQLAGQAEQILLSAIGYNAFGQVDTETAGNGVVTIGRHSPFARRRAVSGGRGVTPLKPITVKSKVKPDWPVTSVHSSRQTRSGGCKPPTRSSRRNL